MGQAAVDLPDPLGQEPLDNTPSADDLLAQMAGEEVDRLLAEAELERPGKEAPPTPAAAIDGGATPQQPATPAQEVQTEKTSEPVVSPVAEGANEVARALDEADPDTAQQLDALFAELNASPAEPISIPARASVKTPAEPDKLNETTPPAAEAPMDQQLDDLFAQLTGDGASSPQEPAPANESPIAEAPVAATSAVAPAIPTQAPATVSAPAPAEAPAPVAPPAEAAFVEAPAVPKTAQVEPAADETLPAEQTTSDKPALDPQEQTGPLEKEVLSAAIPTPIEGTAIAEPSKPIAPVGRKLPLWVRLLELFNAPLAAWGDGVREAVGKIAIMTLINAMALLTYVLVFRRH